MLEGPTPRQWAELRAKRPVSEDALATIPIRADGTDTPLAMAMDQAGQLHLLIPIQGGPKEPKPPDLNGLRIRHRHMDTGQFLDLIANPSHERVFTPVCREVVEAVLVQRREPWAAVATTIRAWQSAWKLARPEMEKSVQIGLFGELLVLRNLMIPSLGPAAVAQWSGPESERHDFIAGQVHLEVKTTTRKSRHEHEISRLDQLRVPAGRQLLVVSVRLEESIGGEETVATCMDSVTDLLRGDAAALDEFMAKMVKLGWSEEMRRSGELLRFTVRDASVYPVDAEFPRLPDDFTPPSGVVSVRYTVDLANLPLLGMKEAVALIKKASGKTPSDPRPAGRRRGTPGKTPAGS